jgi:nitrilase
MNHKLKVALAQISPVWLNKIETLKKVEKAINEASIENAELIVFGEGLVPGYPFWLALTGGAEWDTKVNKELHAHYVRRGI